MESKKEQSGFIVVLLERIFAFLHFISPSKGLKKLIGLISKKKMLYGFVDIYVLAWPLLLCLLLGLSQFWPEKMRAMGLFFAVLVAIRLVEIVGVTMDVLVFDRIRAEAKGEHYFIASPQRTFLLGVINYFEIMLHFALVYFLLFNNKFSGLFNRDSIWDSIYFSALTITTLGYGDFQPRCTSLRMISVLEALAGVLAVALIIARGVSLLRPPKALSDIKQDNPNKTNAADA